MSDFKGYRKAVAIVVATPFPECDAIYVGAGGSATVQIGSTLVAFPGLLIGTIYPFRATNVSAAVAASLVALYR